MDEVFPRKNPTSEIPIRVSVVIPARNEEIHVGDLLASLEALDFSREHLEIIVVNHDSNDGTSAIARKAGARVVDKHGGSIASARNAGARQAAGDVIAFIDADCTVAKDWLNVALPHFSDPRVGAVGRSWPLVPAEPSTWARSILRKQAEIQAGSSRGRWLSSGNMLVRRHVFFEVGEFDEALGTCEDVDLSYRIASKYLIIEDLKIRWWHHGEPRTFWQLFRKELWRGRDGLLGVARHGFRLDEMPTLILPLYFLLTLALFLSSLLVVSFGRWQLPLATCAGAAFFIPLFLLAAFRSLRTGGLRYVGHFTVFYAVYFLARGFSPFYAWPNIKRQS